MILKVISHWALTAARLVLLKTGDIVRKYMDFQLQSQNWGSDLLEVCMYKNTWKLDGDQDELDMRKLSHNFVFFLFFHKTLMKGPL